MKALALSHPGEQIVVVSPKENEATKWAEQYGLNVTIIPKQECYDEILLSAIKDVNIVCLAGYMYLLPENIVYEFRGRILNIHPSLLPKFGGKGMYGMNVHQAVYDAKETETGCTVHLVNERYDDGDILVQKSCTISPDDTPESIASKVLELEHLAYPEALTQQIYRLKQEFLT